MAGSGQDPKLSGGTERKLALELPALRTFIDEVFPQSRENGHSIDSVSPMRACGRLDLKGPKGNQHLRPGGTVSGPSMFSLADYTFYAATLGMIGPVEMAVTVNLTITFLRKPRPVDLICEARILKLGRRMSLGDCFLYSEGDEEPVAQASVAYAIPAG